MSARENAQATRERDLSALKSRSAVLRSEIRSLIADLDSETWTELRHATAGGASRKARDLLLVEAEIARLTHELSESNA